jgi:hypothetical protein
MNTLYREALLAALPAGLKGSSIDCRAPALDSLCGAMLVVGGHAFDGGAPLPVSASARVEGKHEIS